MSASTGTLGAITRAAADLLWPRPCLLSGEYLEWHEPGLVKPRFLPDLRNGALPTVSPWFDGALGDELPCYPAYPYIPGGAVAELILALKHGRLRLALETCAELAADHLAEVAAASGSQVLVPVPLHRSRMWKRGFNQSQLLAAMHPSLPVRELLLRHRDTPSQRGLSSTERGANVHEAFGATAELEAEWDGASVLLIDDVCTTGATLLECSRVLRAAGASEVSAWTLAAAML